METVAYILCALTAAACSALLLRNYFLGRARLLLWCGLSFAALALENAMLLVDFVLVPDIDLFVIRRSVPLVGVLLLLYGFIWDVE